MHAGYQEVFDRHRYQQRLTLIFLRVLPFLLPMWVVIAVVSLRRSRPTELQQTISFDDRGRAFARDAYGRYHRISDFDHQ